MTDNVFNGTLNPTQSIKSVMTVMTVMTRTMALLTVTIVMTVTVLLTDVMEPAKIHWIWIRMRSCYTIAAKVHIQLLSTH